MGRFEIGFLSRFCTNSLLFVFFTILIVMSGIGIFITNAAIQQNTILNHELIEAIKSHEERTGVIARLVPAQNQEILKNLTNTLLENREIVLKHNDLLVDINETLAKLP